MKYLRRFESFSEFDLGRFSEEEEINKPVMADESEEECEPCGDDDDDYVFSSEEEDDYQTEPHRIKRWGDEDIENLDEKKKQKETTYAKSGLKHPEKADLDKNKKISRYEKTRGKAIQNAVQGQKEEKGSKEEKGDKGLTAAQKKLPEGLRKAIEAKNKKK
jgi:hypothetical protein